MECSAFRKHYRGTLLYQARQLQKKMRALEKVVLKEIEPIRPFFRFLLKLIKKDS